jgi:hypothetical protein
MLQAILLLSAIAGIITFGFLYSSKSEKKVIALKYESLKKELLQQNPLVIQGAVVYKKTSSGFKTYVHGDSVTDIFITDNSILITCVKNFIGYPDLLNHCSREGPHKC